MLTNEELKGKYIKYSPEITEEIFDKIVKKLESTDFKSYGYRCTFGGFEEYGNLEFNDGFYQTVIDSDFTEISYKDIIGEENTLIVGNWYELNAGDKWIFKFNRFEPPNKLWDTKSGTPHDNYNDRTGGYHKGTPKQCKLADMEEVYKLFPEEKPVELQLKDLVEGETYKFEWFNTTEYIWKYSTDKAINKVKFLDSFIKPKGIQFTNGILATPEEKQWLNVCIAENKFIERDIALRDYDMNGKALKSESIPEYVEATQNLTGIVIGKIYPYVQNTVIDGKFNNYRDVLTKDDKYFKPSTKALYEAQLQQKEVKEIKFEIGKWYKRDTGTYVKFLKLENNVFIASENINIIDLKHYNVEGMFGNTTLKGNTYTLLTDLSEIQQYLPEGHPDKIVKEWWRDLKKGDYVVSLTDDRGIEEVFRKSNFIYEITQSSKKSIHYKRHSGNIGSTHNINHFRPATPEEIAMYIAAGNKPVDITKYESEVMEEEYKVGDWVLTSSDANGWGSGVNINNQIIQIEEIKTLWGDDILKIFFTFKRKNEVTAYKEIVRKATPEEIYAVGGYPEQKEEPKKDNTEDLLEEAKRRYPIGTKFIACNTQTECIIETEDLRKYAEHTINEYKNGELNSTYTSYHCIYSNGKWAEVISSSEKPVKKSNLPTDKELLEYANKHYVVGTKFISSIVSCDNGKERECKYYDNKSSSFGWKVKNLESKGRVVQCDDGMYTKATNGSSVCSNPYIYSDEEGWCKLTYFPKEKKTNHQFKVGDEVFLPEYGIGKFNDGTVEYRDWALLYKIPLNTKLIIGGVSTNTVWFDGYLYSHAASKFKPISELNKKVKYNPVEWGWEFVNPYEQIADKFTVGVDTIERPKDWTVKLKGSMHDLIYGTGDPILQSKDLADLYRMDNTLTPTGIKQQDVISPILFNVKEI